MKTRGVQNRIPTVAAKYGVKAIDLYEFCDERGLQMKKQIGF